METIGPQRRGGRSRRRNASFRQSNVVISCTISFLPIFLCFPLPSPTFLFPLFSRTSVVCFKVNPSLLLSYPHPNFSPSSIREHTKLWEGDIKKQKRKRHSWYRISFIRNRKLPLLSILVYSVTASHFVLLSFFSILDFSTIHIPEYSCLLRRFIFIFIL